MRLYFAMGLAVTLGGFMAASPAPVAAAEVCHFLECVEGDTQAPPPAPLPRKPAAPAIQNSERPKLPGEICDSAGNLRFRLTARNFNPAVAMAGKICIVEVEKIVEVGELAPDDIHLPGIYVHRIVLNAHPEKRIEQRTLTETK